MNIRSVKDFDLPRIAELHSSELPEDFCAVLGTQFLEKIFYPELLKASEIALVVEESDKVMGYVFFSTAKGFLGYLIRKYFLKMSFIVSRNLWRPSFIFYLSQILRLILLHKPEVSGHELVYIAVSKSMAGKGLGSALVREAHQRLKALGLNRGWVKTMEATPENVKFYQKLGYRISEIYLGRVFLEIDLAINDQTLQARPSGI